MFNGMFNEGNYEGNGNCGGGCGCGMNVNSCDIVWLILLLSCMCSGGCK